MILDAYFARRFALSFVAVTAIFAALTMLIDLIEQVRRFQGGDVLFGQIVGLMLLNTPGALYQILPLLVILATVAMFVQLARSSELVITRGAGRSGIRALLGPLLIVLLVGVMAVALLNPFVAATSNQYSRLVDTYRTGVPAAASLSGEGLWLRQGEDSGQSVVHATGFDSAGAVLHGVTVLTYGADARPVRRIRAESAQLFDGEWTLQQAKIWPLEAGQIPEANAEVHETLRIPSSLTRERIRDSIGRALGVSIWDLPQTIADLREAGFATRQQEVQLQSELATPLFLLSMMLIGAAFTMRHSRSGGTGLAVLVAVLLAFGLYFVRNFALVLGQNGQLPVALSAWAPPVAAGLFGLGLMLTAEDG
jgi:lipopolysaccharide export system permease protein